MTDADGAASLEERDLRTEIGDLRHGLLQVLLPTLLAIAWIWFMYVVSVRFPIGLNQLPVLILPTTTWFGYQLAQKHHTAGSWVLLLGAMLSVSVIVAAHPQSLAIAFGILIPVIAVATLGSYHALIATALMWAAGTVARNLGMASPRLVEGTFDVLVLYALAWGAAWLATRSLNTLVERALMGWRQANEMLSEVRQRRAELYRVVRALDEASYRIERMNQELIVARREAEMQRALKSRFVAMVSHELRGPLNLILGFSRLIAVSPEVYSEPLPEAYRADIDAIYRNSQHLVTLIDDILDLSQIEAQRLPLIKDRVEIESDVIRKIAQVVEPLAERKGLYLHLQLAGDLPWILADQVRLRQSLLNLLMNAVRFTDRGGITISSFLRDNMLLVSVQDTGIGVAPEDIPKLFQEFRQLRPGEKREAGGSGLGLNITRQLVELHGGKVWAEGKPGCGTTFWLSLPLPGTDNVASDLTRTEELGPGQSNGEICIVAHDDPMTVRVLSRYLEHWQVVGLPHAEDVVAFVGKLHPRAIITTPDRLAFIQARLSAEALDVPIISCGLPQTTDDEQRGKITGYLIKPVSAEALAAMVRPVEKDGETTVLLVDDDPDAVRLLESMLVLIPRPYRILKAYSGLEALEMVENVVPDIMLIDLIMPGLNGEETIARMRADERLRHVPIVVVSAQDMSEASLSLNLPICMFRCKPLELAGATRCLQALLETVNPQYLRDVASS